MSKIKGDINREMMRNSNAWSINAPAQPAKADAVILQLVEALENHGGNYKLTKTEAVKVNAAIDAGRNFIAARQ